MDALLVTEGQENRGEQANRRTSYEIPGIFCVVSPSLGDVVSFSSARFPLLCSKVLAKGTLKTLTTR